MIPVFKLVRIAYLSPVHDPNAFRGSFFTIRSMLLSSWLVDKHYGF